ncbi:PREDICTED: cyclin-dependent kinase inhibitor 1 [Chrysochloris asiatica]|uniref:Cyclin-dependent kinase inhibitor 1 n=1 Tax=Chrysochloris asiatica TaxID=185453 RepID=A0A9B0T8U6_CHRAS|nr:PREDICTED: cyclin-dependent kinase inhibitor 1 [Chrysochloris asiatica]
MSEQIRYNRQIPCSLKVCRRLFGVADQQQVRRDCDALMASYLQEARKRWNFDFATETPLEGNYVWERVPSLGLPKIYKSTACWATPINLGGGKPPSAGASSAVAIPGTSQGAQASGSGTGRSEPLEEPEVAPAVPLPRGRKRGQTSMTDFYYSKRRLVFSKKKP